MSSSMDVDSPGTPFLPSTSLHPHPSVNATSAAPASLDKTCDACLSSSSHCCPAKAEGKPCSRCSAKALDCKYTPGFSVGPDPALPPLEIAREYEEHRGRKGETCKRCQLGIEKKALVREGMHAVCYQGFRIVRPDEKDLTFCAVHIPDNPAAIGAFIKALGNRIWEEKGYAPPASTESDRGFCLPSPLPAPQFKFGDARIVENSAFFHALFGTVELWKAFGGDLRGDVDLQRRLVRKLLEEICHVFADVVHLSDLEVYSISAYLVGVLRWLAGQTTSICKEHRGEALLVALEAFWKQETIRKVMLDMCQQSKRYIEDCDLAMWSAKPTAMKSIRLADFMKLVHEIEELLGASSANPESTAVLSGLMLSAMSRNSAYWERPPAVAKPKIVGIKRQTRAPAQTTEQEGEDGAALAEPDAVTSKKGKKTKKIAVAPPAPAFYHPYVASAVAEGPATAAASTVSASAAAPASASASASASTSAPAPAPAPASAPAPAPASVSVSVSASTSASVPASATATASVSSAALIALSPASARGPSSPSTLAGPASAAQSAVQTRPQYGRRIKRRYDEENHGDAQHLPSTSLLPPQLQVEGSQASPAATSAIGAKPVANNRNAAWAHAAAAPSTDMAESTATPPAESSSSRVTVDAATGRGGFALMGSSTDERGPAGEHAMSNARSASASSRLCSVAPASPSSGIHETAIAPASIHARAPPSDTTSELRPRCSTPPPCPSTARLFSPLRPDTLTLGAALHAPSPRQAPASPAAVSSVKAHDSRHAASSRNADSAPGSADDSGCFLPVSTDVMTEDAGTKKRKANGPPEASIAGRAANAKRTKEVASASSTPARSSSSSSNAKAHPAFASPPVCAPPMPAIKNSRPTQSQMPKSRVPRPAGGDLPEGVTLSAPTRPCASLASSESASEAEHMSISKVYVRSAADELQARIDECRNLIRVDDVHDADAYILDTEPEVHHNIIYAIQKGIPIINQSRAAIWIEEDKATLQSEEAFEDDAFVNFVGCPLAEAVERKSLAPAFLQGLAFHCMPEVIGGKRLPAMARTRLVRDVKGYIEAAGGQFLDSLKNFKNPSTVYRVYRDKSTEPESGRRIEKTALMNMLFRQERNDSALVQ